MTDDREPRDNEDWIDPEFDRAMTTIDSFEADTCREIGEAFGDYRDMGTLEMAGRIRGLLISAAAYLACEVAPRLSADDLGEVVLRAIDSIEEHCREVAAEAAERN